MKCWSHDEQFGHILPAFSVSLLSSFSQFMGRMKKCDFFFRLFNERKWEYARSFAVI